VRRLLLPQPGGFEGLRTYLADDPRVVQVEVEDRRFMPVYRLSVVPLGWEGANPFDGAEGLGVVVLAWGSWLGGGGRGSQGTNESGSDHQRRRCNTRPSHHVALSSSAGARSTRPALYL
jgi:hypothetical protein